MDPISGLLSLGGGIINNLFAGSRQSDAQAFAASQVQNQQNFQERMRSTAYQTAVEDMKKAGLNPMMMAGVNTSVPTGGAATSIAPAPVHDMVGPALSTAMQSAKVKSELAKQVLEMDNLKKDNEIKNEQVFNIAADTYKKMQEKRKTSGEADIVQQNFEEAFNNSLKAKNERPYLESMIAKVLQPTAKGVSDIYKMIPPIRIQTNKGTSARSSDWQDSSGNFGTANSTGFDSRFNASFGR